MKGLMENVATAFMEQFAEQIEAERAKIREEVFTQINDALSELESNSYEFQVTALQEMIRRNMPLGTPRPYIEMFVQPSVLQDFYRTGSNLLTLSRSGAFPFTQKLKVML